MVEFLSLPKEVYPLASAWKRPSDQRIKVRLRFSRDKHKPWRSGENYVSTIQTAAVPNWAKVTSVWVRTEYFPDMIWYYYADVLLDEGVQEDVAVAIAIRWVRLRKLLLSWAKKGETQRCYRKGSRVYFYSPLMYIGEAAVKIDEEFCMPSITNGDT